MQDLKNTLLLAAMVLAVAFLNVRCCDSQDARDELDATTYDTGLGCFPRYDGQQLYQSDISPADDWICCHYQSLETDEQRAGEMYCGTREDVGQDSPFFVVERP